jgi:proteasome lid subunit RPN8/RPN11
MRPANNSSLALVKALKVEELILSDKNLETIPTISIHLSQNVHQTIADHAMSDLDHEVMGLLLGTVKAEAGEFEVTIAQALPARATISTKVSVQLSYESWEYFIREKAQHYAELVTLGWYHTHPGFGAFLSGMDKFIHKNFFGKAWQIALVVDPTCQQWEFFQHRNNEVGPLAQVSELNWRTVQPLSAW